MGKKGRLRRELVTRGLLAPFRTASVVSRAAKGDPIAREQLETTVSKAVGLRPDEVTASKIAKACQLIHPLIRVQGIQAVRAQIRDHIPAEIRTIRANGHEPVAFYWDIRAFREVWTKLGWTKEDLEEMVRDVPTES